MAILLVHAAAAAAIGFALPRSTLKPPNVTVFVAVQTASTQTRKAAHLTEADYDGTTKIGDRATTCTGSATPIVCTSTISLNDGTVKTQGIVNRSPVHHGTIDVGPGGERVSPPGPVAN